MIRMLVHKLLDCHDERGEGAFHVGCAAAIQHAVAYRRGERIAIPLIERTGRNDVRVSRKAHQRACRTAPRPQIVDPALADFFAFETERLQVLAQEIETTCVCRCYRIAGYQLARKIDDGNGHGPALQ
jgi:hypothetical protein